MSQSLTAMPVVASCEQEIDRCVELHLLHDGPLAQVMRWRCLHDGEALRAERQHTTYVLSVVSGGACEILDGAWRATLDPATAVLHRPGSSYRTTHPFGLFDRGWSIAYREELAEEILERGGVRPRKWERPSRTVGAALFPLPVREQALLRSGSDLEKQELAIEFLERIAKACRDPKSSHRPETLRHHRRIVDRTRECLRSRMFEPLDLDELARDVGASPAHLCRMFKRGTGMTIRGYLHRLRLAHALARVEDGEDSLMRVALESGFYSHSHLTATCTRLLGSPPATLRIAN